MGDDELRAFMGARLRQARMESGLSQAEVGSMLGLTYSGYGDFERGRSLVSVPQLLMLCRIFRKPISFFVGYVDADADILGIDELTHEIVSLVHQIPERERLAVLTYARFVAEQAAKDAQDEAQ